METVTLEMGDTTGPQSGIQYINIVPSTVHQTTDDATEEHQSYCTLTNINCGLEESYETACNNPSGNVSLPSGPTSQFRMPQEQVQVSQVDNSTILQSQETYSLSDLLSGHSTTGMFGEEHQMNGQQQPVYIDSMGREVTALSGMRVVSLPSMPLAANTPSLCNVGKSYEPLYVNARQYHRILKRREARAKLEARGRVAKERSKYIYNSRHVHATKRQRGPGGKFLKLQSPLSSINKENL